MTLRAGVTTSVPSWTPLGTGWNKQALPGPDQRRHRLPGPRPEPRVLRARPRPGRAGFDPAGRLRRLHVPRRRHHERHGVPVDRAPTGGACTPSCTAGYPGADDYLLAARGTSTTCTPFFTWNALAGRQSYFVIVATDPSFSNLVDYAFTQLPVYSPRNLLRPTTYADETTLYYWAILPATNLNGSGAVGDPLAAAASNFQKRSTPPSQLSPADGALMTEQPVFRGPRSRAPALPLPGRTGADFAALLEDVTTASTSYTPFTTHPADTNLYWRVRADDENLIGLTWSSVRQFQRRLPTPVPASDNATSGDFTPCGCGRTSRARRATRSRWTAPKAPREGRTCACAPARSSTCSAPASGAGEFAPSSRRRVVSRPAPGRPSLHSRGRSASPPTCGRASRATTCCSRWKLGAKNFRVQISSRQDFNTLIEDVTTDNTSYAPLLLHYNYVNGGTLLARGGHGREPQRR